jgi:hypothetical protein
LPDHSTWSEILSEIIDRYIDEFAGVAKLVDAPDSECAARTGVGDSNGAEGVSQAPPARVTGITESGKGPP